MKNVKIVCFFQLTLNDHGAMISKILVFHLNAETAPWTP